MSKMKFTEGYVICSGKKAILCNDIKEVKRCFKNKSDILYFCIELKNYEKRLDEIKEYFKHQLNIIFTR
jgi:hypothetical protein